MCVILYMYRCHIFLSSHLVVTWRPWLGAVGVGCLVWSSQDRQLWIGDTMVSDGYGHYTYMSVQ